MLDVEFIRKPAPNLTKVITYQMNEGVFRADLVSRVSHFMYRRNIQFQEADYNNFMESIGEPSLFGETMILVDLVEHGKFRDKFFQYIQKGTYNNRYLVLLNEIPEEFQDVFKYATNIQEVKLTRANVKKILPYLHINNKLLDGDKIENPNQFQVALEGFVESEKMTLAEFIQRFYFYTGVCFQDNYFDLMAFKSLVSKDKTDYYKWHKLVYQLLVNPSKLMRARFFKEVELCLSRGLTVKIIISNLFKAVRDLTFVNTQLNKSEDTGLSEYEGFKLKQFENIPVKSLLRLQLLLAKYEGELNTGNFLIVLDDFLGEV